MDSGVNAHRNNRNPKAGDKLENILFKILNFWGDFFGIPRIEFCFGVFYHEKQLLSQHIWAKKVLYQYPVG